MVVLDPAVFRSTVLGVGSPLLGPVKAFGYCGIALGIATLLVCLLSQRPRAILAGCLAGGCLFSVGMGVALLPFALLGTIFFGIGLLGLSPFLCALVFGRWSHRIFVSAPPKNRRWAVSIGFVLYLTVTIGTQLATSRAYERAIADIVSGEPKRLERGISRLERWALVVDVDQMAIQWSERTDEEGKNALAAAYRRVTGGEIGERSSQLAD
jgi:hypothetical protein